MFTELSMPNPFEQAPIETMPPDVYDDDYFLAWPGKLFKFFAYKPERDIPRAQAIAEAVGLQPGDRVLDFGCGPGAMTAAFNAAGYPTVGLDTSPHAIRNAIPEARDRVRQLGGTLSLSDLPNDMVDLVICKEVFEHLDESEIHEIVDELTCIGRRVLAIIPTTDSDGRFIFKQYDRDPTHITKLTRDLLLGRFAYGGARDLEDITDLLYREDKIPGTICLLLEETDPKIRTMRMRDRARAHTPMWRQLLGLPPSRFDVDFNNLLH